MPLSLSRTKVYIAGICSLLVTVGVARFSYTPLLPIMQNETGLSDLAGGWLATSNYMGYMSGVLLAASLHKLAHKYWLHQIYLLLSVITAAAMALTTDLWLWSALRFVAGVCASGGLIIASGLVLKWMVQHRHRAELGIHFTGIGLSIALSAALVELLLIYSANWQQQWLAFALIAVPLCVPAWRWMPNPSGGPKGDHSDITDQPPGPQFKRLMLLAYFCAGYGYVVSATFIVDMVEALEALQDWGPMIFIVVGLAATPAVLLWDRLARQIGYLKALWFAYALQAVGILLPTLSHALWSLLLSAALFGATFVACVSLVLTMAGLFYPSNPARFMGRMTLAYGVAQIMAPLITGFLVERLGNYDLGLYLSAGIMLLGCSLVLKLLKLSTQPAQSKHAAMLCGRESNPLPSLNS